MSSTAVSRYQTLLMVKANDGGGMSTISSFKYQQTSEYEKELEDKAGQMMAVWWINQHTHNTLTACIEIFINSEPLSKNEDN